MVERVLRKHKVAGSIPVVGFWLFFYITHVAFFLYEEMDKALVFGTKDCRFESYRGQFYNI